MAERDPLGPLPARVRNPLYLLQLQSGPRPAATLSEGVVRLDAQLDWANIFDVWGRTTPEGRQVSDLDMEIVRAAFGARLGLLPGLEVGVEVPLLALSGGISDGIIQAWHRLLHADNGGREEVRDGRFGYRVSIPDVIEYSPDPTRLAVGDVVLDAAARVLRRDGWQPDLLARFLAKLPTGRLERGTGSGLPDLGVTLHVGQRWRRLAGTAYVGVTLFGREGEFGALLRPASVPFGFGLELMLTRGLSAVVQLDGTTSFNHGFAHHYSWLSPMSLTAGARFRVGQMVFGLAMEQDVLNGDPSADLTIVVDAALAFGHAHKARAPRK